MARMKFLCDSERCIECNGCVTACKNANETEWGIQRRRVVTLDDGEIGKEVSISVACMHCSDAPCMAVCPTNCFYPWPLQKTGRRMAFLGERQTGSNKPKGLPV